MKINKQLIICILAMLPFWGHSQVNVTSYSIYALGVGIPIHEKISLEMKTFANRPIENIIFEFAGFYHFKPGDFHQFSAGAGLGLNSRPFTGETGYISLPLALEIFPIQSFKRISLMMEVALELYGMEYIKPPSPLGNTLYFCKKE